MEPDRRVDEGEVPPDVVAALARICAGLPEAYEEVAWTGVRWRIRTRTFAHVLLVESGWPPAYARASGTDGPATVLMFRSAGAELEALRTGGQPFFTVPWRADEVGLVIGPGTDWTEVEELVVESYCLLAPQRLAATIREPR